MSDLKKKEITWHREERKKGQWYRAWDEKGESWMCSECFEEFVAPEPDEFPKWAHYCPNCGVEMEAPNEQQEH